MCVSVYLCVHICNTDYKPLFDNTPVLENTVGRLAIVSLRHLFNLHIIH